jgi:methylmalonyl-CoA mutase N-terminal domain/subunit
MLMRMIAGGGGGGLTFEQPEVNIVRGAYYALISALSGAQTMALCCYDEAYTIPSEHAQRLSLRTMQLLIEEMGLCDTVDPLGGAWYVETLTNQMRTRIEEIIADVDARGGIVPLIADGHIQAQVSAQAYAHQKALEDGSFRKVGVNCYRTDDAAPAIAFHPYRDEDAAGQVAALERVRRTRDPARVRDALARVRADAHAGVNLMPALVEAVAAYASVGERTGEMIGVFGRYREPIRF